MSVGFQVQFLRGSSPLSKRIANDSQCPRNNQNVEDVNHALCICTFAKDVWKLQLHCGQSGMPGTRLSVLATGAFQSILSTIVHWSLSLVNVVKVNVDDGFVLAQRKACSKVIIRDEYGQILGACSWLTNQVSTVFAAEALAVDCGLHFAYDMGFLLRNRAAYAMARDGLLRGEDCFWVEKAPTLVVAAADED
ncbi:hypothetical protein J1N35_041330 [Gossypium stocksii]|uniref:RNase H type-1 domain-containing protein n=1 Tax=Gossypium stocksii TaxID=47602 RepID=A0A9D3UFA0_9ROSI|nr:hypothetical protein J1N35_041330 [Gossypium stocksii]